MIALIIGIVWGILGFIFFVLITKRVEKIGEEETPNWKVAVLVCGCGPFLWFIVLVSVIGNFAIEHISKWLVKK